MDAIKDLIGKRVNVLDKGWIELLDLMPHPDTGISGDLAIVNAARVSFMGESKGAEKDKKLLFYLVKHRHTSPFEQVQFKFRMHAPVVTFWQWVRHRTWCLSGDAEIYFDLPNGVKKNRRTCHKVKLKKLYDWWQSGTQSVFKSNRKPLFTENIEVDREYTIPELAQIVSRREETLRTLVTSGRLSGEKRNGRIYVKGQHWLEYANSAIRTLINPMRDRVSKMYLRMCDESTGEIVHTHISDVLSSGVRPVFEVTLDNGNALKMSKDHRILTESGWMTLEQATGLNLTRNGSVNWRSDAPRFAVNGVPVYKDLAWMKSKRLEGLDVSQIASEAGVSYHTIRKYLSVHGLQFTKQECAVLSGKAQRGQKRLVKPLGKMSESRYERYLLRMSGKNSHFWKGGITPERALIGEWTRKVAPRIHARFEFKCVVCGMAGQKLHAHHIDPVWHNPSLAKDEGNLVSMCDKCHRQLHSRNLEIQFLEAWPDKGKINDFAQLLLASEQSIPSLEGKRKPGGVRLVRTYAKVKSIRYCGEEETYDLTVAGPYHNFVANGFIVHNSFNFSSGRYVEFNENDFYVPDVWRKQSPSNKQASLGQVENDENQQLTQELIEHYDKSYQLYEKALHMGVAREQARLFLPGWSSYYTCIGSIDAHNLMHFLSLRLPQEAQYEIRVYAEAIYEHFFKPALPWTAEAFETIKP
ncbi:MAG: FAD-dependent thymidylate synthase [Anaerolineae bacterium]|nr:FAD-dependent thymidylate synthase [Anaerolineae bacterium]